MLLTHLHLASRVLRLTALVALATALSGCEGVTGIQPATQVRVVDASPDAPALDIYQNSSAALYNIGFGTVSSYIPLAPGAYTHAAYTAGTQQQLATVRGTFSPGSQYTVLTGNIAASLQMSVLKDQSFPAPAGQVALRILGQHTRFGAVDIYLLPSGSSFAAASPIASGLAFGGNTGYILAPAGTYSIVAFSAGSLPAATRPVFTGSQAEYPSGSVRTIVLIDQLPAQSAASSPGLQLITADDVTPAS
jgi:hypothetical protein